MSAEAEPRRGGGVGGVLSKLVMLALGLLVGVFAGAVMLDRPDAVAQIWEAIQAQFQQLRYGDLAFPRMVLGLIAILVAVMSFYVLMRSFAMIGIGLGVAAWAPFGAHILAYVPEVRVQFPALEANMVEFVAEREQLAGLRDWGLAMAPLPEGAVVAVDDANVTEQAEAGSSRLPQIED